MAKGIKMQETRRFEGAVHASNQIIERSPVDQSITELENEGQDLAAAEDLATAKANSIAVKDEEHEQPTTAEEEIKNMKNDDEEAMRGLVELRQTSNVKSYKKRFQKLATKVKQLPEEFFISCFINGLKEEIKIGVQKFQSFPLDQAIGLALLQELSIEYTKSSNFFHNEDVGNLEVEDNEVKSNTQGKEDCSSDLNNYVLQKWCHENISDASAIIFDKVELDEATNDKQLRENSYHNKMLNKKLDDKETEKLIQIKLGMKEQKTDSVEKSNHREVENATWMLTVFHCFDQYFCLHFEAFQIGIAPVYMASLHCPISCCSLIQDWLFFSVVTNKKRFKGCQWILWPKRREEVLKELIECHYKNWDPEILEHTFNDFEGELPVKL